MKAPTSLAQAGFTLLELVITIMLLGVLSALGTTLLSTGFRAYLQGQELTEGSVQARLALGRMTRDLRDVMPGKLLTLATNGLSFIDSNGDTITYSVSGTDLLRKKNTNAAQVLAQLLVSNGLTLTYLQKDAVTTALTVSQVYYITIQLTINYPSRFGTNYLNTTRTSIYLRNV